MGPHICHMTGNLLVIRTIASLSQAHNALVWWVFLLVINYWNKDYTWVMEQGLCLRGVFYLKQ